MLSTRYRVSGSTDFEKMQLINENKLVTAKCVRQNRKVYLMTIITISASLTNIDALTISKKLDS